MQKILKPADLCMQMLSQQLFDLACWKKFKSLLQRSRLLGYIHTAAQTHS